MIFIHRLKLFVVCLLTLFLIYLGPTAPVTVWAHGETHSSSTESTSSSLDITGIRYSADSETVSAAVIPASDTSTEKRSLRSMRKGMIVSSKTRWRAGQLPDTGLERRELSGDSPTVNQRVMEGLSYLENQNVSTVFVGESLFDRLSSMDRLVTYQEETSIKVYLPIREHRQGRQRLTWINVKAVSGDGGE